MKQTIRPITWLILIGSLLVIGTMGFLWWKTRTVPPTYSDSTTLDLRANGGLFEGKNLIGHVDRIKGEDVLTLPIADAAPEVVSDLTVTINLPSNLLILPPSNLTSIQGTAGMEVYLQNKQTIITAFEEIIPESHTVLRITFPPGYLKPSWYYTALSSLTSIPVILWYLASFIIILGTLLYYLSKTHRSFTTKTIQNHPPEDLHAVELAILLNGTIDASTIAALLYDLANRGYLEIVEKKDTHFFRTTRQEGLRAHEQLFLDAIVPTSEQPPSLRSILKDLNRSIFSEVVGTIYVEAYAGLTERLLFSSNPRFTHLYYKTIGIMIQLFSILIGISSYFLPALHIPGLIFLSFAGYLCGYILYRMAFHLFPLTKEGNAVREEALAFKNYLASREVIGSEGSQGYLFYQYLPYALVSNSVEPWLARFQAIRWYVPVWFTMDGAIVSPDLFLANLQGILSLFSATFVHLKDPNVD